jgi:hypothetical protein
MPDETRRDHDQHEARHDRQVDLQIESSHPKPALSVELSAAPSLQAA